MIGTTILTLLIFSMVYPVLTKEKITRGKGIWLYKQQKRKEHLKQWKPTSKDSELILTKTGMNMKGGWRSRPKLRNRLKDKKTKLICKIAITLLFTGLIYHFTGNVLSLGITGFAFTSKASGDWDAVGQTTWNEINSPISADTAQINNTHVVRIDAGTGNEACLSIDVQSGGALLINSEAGGALSLTFDDAVGAGFGASDGTLICVGTNGNVVTITSAATPPTNYWDFFTTMDITADFSIFSFHDRLVIKDATADINNCTISFTNSEGINFASGSLTLTSFDNNTIDNTGGDGLIWGNASSFATIDNLIITNVGGSEDIRHNVGNRRLEFTNSNFNIINITGNGTIVISDNHNDVAGDWHYWAKTVGNKSNITNDFNSADNVTIQTGSLTCDEATAHNNLTIKSGGTFDVDPNITQTITDTGTVTIELGGTLEWTGTAGNLITLVSDNPGTQWSLVNNGTVNVSFVDVTDSDASGGDIIDASDGTNIGRTQNNDNWDFGGAGSAVSQPALAFWLS